MGLKIALKLAVLTIVCAATVAAHAATYTYSYVGLYFTAVNNPAEAFPSLTTSDRITGWFTVASPLGNNFVGTIVPASFSFSNGIDTISSSSSTSSEFTLATDAAGMIYSTDIHIGKNPFGTVYVPPECYCSGDYYLMMGIGGNDTTQYQGINGGDYNQAEVSGRGIWSLSATPASGTTPEPESLLLAGTGSFAGIWEVLRRRRRCSL